MRILVYSLWIYSIKNITKSIIRIWIKENSTFLWVKSTLFVVIHTGPFKKYNLTSGPPFGYVYWIGSPCDHMDC